MSRAVTPDQLAEELAAKTAEAEELRTRVAAVEVAGAEARRAAELKMYRDAWGDLAHQYRDARDELKRQLDELAKAPELDIIAVANAFTAMKTADAQCGAPAQHASQLHALEGPLRNHIGVEVPRTFGIGANELYKDWTLTRYLDSVIAARTDAVRSRHAQELREGVYAEAKAAEEAARTAAASGSG